MGCGPSSDPLLADIYDSYEQKYDFEQIFPSDSYGTFNASLSTESESLKTNETIIVNDDEIDVNNNSANLSESSTPYDILVDLNAKISKLIIRLTQYKGKQLQPIIKLGLNESKHSPIRNQSEYKNDREDEIEHDYIMKGNNRGLINMEFIIAMYIRSSGVDVKTLCPQRFFPNDIKAMIISFYSSEHPKLSAFRTIIPTAILCRNTLNLCSYIGTMLSQKLLFQDKMITNAPQINQQMVISEDNAIICRQLIFLFHYILCLDQYKMPKQQPLTNSLVNIVSI